MIAQSKIAQGVNLVQVAPFKMAAARVTMVILVDDVVLDVQCTCTGHCYRGIYSDGDCTCTVIISGCRPGQARALPGPALEIPTLEIA